MGIAATHQWGKPHSKTPTRPSKTASGIFSQNANRLHLRNRPHPLKPQQETTPHTQKTASGVLYYGYRYYDPIVGRWINRDSIEENGGHNLYAFLANQGIQYVDYLGNLKVRYHYDDAYGASVENVSGFPKGKFQGLAKFEGQVYCTCDTGCVMTCGVISSTSIRMNLAWGAVHTESYKMSLAHERWHVMSWGFKVKERVVDALTEEQSSFSDAGECNAAIITYEEKYQALLDKLSKGEGNADGNNDHKGQKYSTIYSPKKGTPLGTHYTRFKKYPKWLRDMKKDSKGGAAGSYIFGNE